MESSHQQHFKQKEQDLIKEHLQPPRENEKLQEPPLPTVYNHDTPPAATAKDLNKQ